MENGPETISIDGTDYIRADKQAKDYSNSPVKIVVLQRGWVVVGRYSRDGETISLDNASTIRRWGTTKGLGELVDGPLTSTRLDKCGHVEFNVMTTIMEIGCSETGWKL